MFTGEVFQEGPSNISFYDDKCQLFLESYFLFRVMDYYYLFRYRKTMNRSDFYSLQDSFYREPREWISTHETKE